jgi:hypothetical protein
MLVSIDRRWFHPRSSGEGAAEAKLIEVEKQIVYC